MEKIKSPGRVRTYLKENWRYLATLTLTTACAAYAGQEPLQNQIAETGYKISIALAKMPPEMKEEKLANLEKVKARRHRRLPNIIARTEEREQFFAEMPDVFDGSKTSVNKMKGKYTPRNFIHTYERLVYGVEESLYEMAQQGADTLIKDASLYATAKPEVEFLEITKDMVMPKDAYEESMSLSLDSLSLKQMGMQNRQDCDSRAKDWIILLSELYPDRLDKIYVQDFLDHRRILYEIDGQKYILEGVIPRFPDKKTEKANSIVMPLSGFLAKLLHIDIDQIEGVEYLGPGLKWNRSFHTMTDAVFSGEDFWHKAGLGNYGLDRDYYGQTSSALTLRDEQDLLERELHRTTASPERENEMVEKIVKRNEEKIRRIMEERKAAKEAAKKAAAEMEAQNDTGKEKAPEIALPKSTDSTPDGGHSVEETIPEPQNPVILSLPVYTENFREIPIEIDLINIGPLNAVAVRSELAKVKSSDNMPDFTTYEQITVDGARELDKLAGDNMLDLNFGFLKSFEPGSWKALNRTSKFSIRLNPNAVTESLIAEINSNPAQMILFTDLTPELVQLLLKLKDRTNIYFDLDAIDAKDAELLVKIKPEHIQKSISVISDEAAAIFLSNNVRVLSDASVIRSYNTAKLFLQNYIRPEEEKSPLPIDIQIPLLTADIARAFGESGLSVIFNGRMVIADNALPELLRNQETIGFRERTGINPQQANHLKTIRGRLFLSVTVMPPNIASLLQEKKGDLIVKSHIMPIESLTNLLQKKSGLSVVLNEISEEHLSAVKDYKGEVLTLSGRFTVNDLEYLANNVSGFKLRLSGTISSEQKRTHKTPLAFIAAPPEDYEDMETVNRIRMILGKNDNIEILREDRADYIYMP